MSRPLSVQPLRWLSYASIAAFEATHAFVVLLLLGTIVPSLPVQWLVLWIVVGAAAFAAGRWPVEGGGPRLAQVPLALLVVLWATKTLSIGGWLPWQDWSQPAATFPLAQVYIALLTSLWCWWRGLGVLDHDHGSLLQLLGRSVLLITIGGCLVAIV